MAHEYRKAAKESQEKKLKAYGADEKHTGKAKNWAGFDALNTDEQRGLKPINKEPELSKETAPRIMRKKGGKVVGADSLKRLDKAPRKARQTGGVGAGMSDTDKDFIENPEAAMRSAERLREIRSEKSKEEGPTREEAETINRKQRYSIEDLDARKKGGKVEHDDEAMDRKLVKKMVKGDALTGKKDGGRAKRAEGGSLINSSSDSDSDKKTSTKGKTTVNIMIGQPSMETPGMPGKGVGAMPAPLSGALPPGAGAPPPPPMPMGMGAPGAMPPGGGMPMVPPGGPAGAPPMMRKDGGKVAYKKPGRKGEYPAMEFGSGSGFGRKQKMDAYGEKPVPYNKDNY